MLVKARLTRDANNKFGINLRMNSNNRPCIESINNTGVDDARGMLRVGDEIVSVNNIDLRGVASLIGVKEVIANSGDECTMEVRREEAPLPYATGPLPPPPKQSVPANQLWPFKNPARMLQERAEEERRRRAEEQRRLEQLRERDEERRWRRMKEEARLASEEQAKARKAAEPDLMNLSLDDEPSQKPAAVEPFGDLLSTADKAPAPSQVDIGPPPGPPPAHIVGAQRPAATPFAGVHNGCTGGPTMPVFASPMQHPPPAAPGQGNGPASMPRRPPGTQMGPGASSGHGAQPPVQPPPAPVPAVGASVPAGPGAVAGHGATPVPAPALSPPPQAQAPLASTEGASAPFEEFLQPSMPDPLMPTGAALGPQEQRKQAILDAFDPSKASAQPAGEGERPKKTTESLYGGLVNL